MKTPTQRPWETSSIGGTNWDVCAPGGGDMIADLFNCDNAEANANHIVLCVNSYDALEAFVQAFDAWAAADQADKAENAEMLRLWTAVVAARKALAEK